MLNTYLFYTLLFLVVGVPFYFQSRMQEMAKDQSALPAINSLTAKLSAFVILSLYAMSFLSFQVKNASYSKVGFCACILSFFLLYAFRGKIIHQIRDIPASPKERFQKSFRTLLAMSLLYAIYFVTVQLLIPHTGTIPALAVAMIFITYSTPLFVRVWMPTRKMHDSPIKWEIMGTFASAGNPVHEVYLIDSDKFKSYNALVCGPKYGFGPLKRSVFITKNLFEVLEPEEIKAVICHEAAHFKLNHVFKRGCMSIVAIFVALVVAFLPISFISILLKMSVDQNYGVLILSTLATVIVQLNFMFRVIRKQEFEADLEALSLGANVASLTSALEKITDQNGVSRKKADWISNFMFGNAHPHTDERIQAIQEGRPPENSRILPPWKYSLPYAGAVMILGGFATLEFDNKNFNPNREVASTQEPETGQILPTEDKRFNRNDPDSE